MNITGRCGLCGDNWRDERPRKHELGGEFGEGVIVKTYVQGSTIWVVGTLVYNHSGGKFVTNICNLDEFGVESEECFAKNPVYTATGELFYEVPDHEHRHFPYQITLPAELHCNHCVLQWTYVTANDTGICPDGQIRFGKNKF